MENKEDLYVIGFPKSGNTWLARLLSDATNSKIHVLSEKDVVNNSENSDDKNGKYVIHKIHVANDLGKVLKSKKVYIVRDVRASIVSGFFHNYRNIGEDKIKSNSFYKIFFAFEINNLNISWNKTFSHYRNLLSIRIKGNLSFIPKVNSWSQHVNFWTSLNDVIIVRYEDLHENTFLELKKVLDELGISYANEELNRVIENQSFAKKKKEFLEKGDTENAKFLRSGEKESWRKLLSPKLQNKIETTHKEMMKKFGYKAETI